MRWQFMGGLRVYGLRGFKVYGAQGFRGVFALEFLGVKKCWIQELGVAFSMRDVGSLQQQYPK